MANEIIIKHGIKTNLPILSNSELGFVTDEQEIYIGTGSANIRILTEDDIYTDSDVDIHLSAANGITYTLGVISPTYGSLINTICQGNDSRLGDSREWTAVTVSQIDAEAGTSTTRSAWTAERVKQAIIALGGAGGGGYVETFTAATSWTVTHNLNSYSVIVQCWDSDTASSVSIQPDTITRDSVNQITISWGSQSVAGQVCVSKCD